MRGRLLTLVAFGAVLGFVAGAPDLLRGSVLFALGRAGTCSAAQSIYSYRNRRHQQWIEREFAGRSQMAEFRNGFERWTTPRGEYWVRPRSALMFLLAEQARGLYGLDHRGVQAGDWVLDCGANVGVFVREALERGAAKVIAVEPSPENVLALRLTFVQEIAEGRVIVYPKGVWDKEDTLTMWSYDNTALDSLVMNERSEETKPPKPIAVPLVTIDQLARELALPRLDFIKMDIEGAERQALTGARTTLARFRPRLAIALENLKDDQEVVPALLRDTAPTYVGGVGDCLPQGQFEIRPEVAFYAPRPQ